MSLLNYWGYSTVSFFAPKSAYGINGQEGSQVVEFKRMVKELHDAGIEVILDVVFNHTAEGDETGRTISFRGSTTRSITCWRRTGAVIRTSPDAATPSTAIILWSASSSSTV